MLKQGKAVDVVNQPGSSASFSDSINDGGNKGEGTDSESQNAHKDGVDKNDTEPDFESTSDN